MSSTNSRQTPDFEFTDEVKPYVLPSPEPKFRAGDWVYLLSEDGTSRQGPYRVATLPATGVYTLSDDAGTAVSGGAHIEEKRLEKK